MAKLNLGGIVLIVVGFLLVMYGAGKIANVFSTVPTFLPYFEAWMDDQGVYVGAHTTEREGQYYGYVAYKLDSATQDGQPITLATTPYDTGNGICGIYACSGYPDTYYLVAGDICPTTTTFKIYDLAEPSGTVQVTVFSSRGDATDLNWLQTIATPNACRDASERRTGSAAFGLTGAFTLTETFETTTPDQCGNSVCDSGETPATCPGDCQSEELPINDVENMGIAIIGLLLIGGGLWVVK